jgi:hypothetical protein
MARRINTAPTPFAASPADVIMRDPRDSNGLWRISRSAENLKAAWQAIRVIARTDRDLCCTGLG